MPVAAAEREQVRTAMRRTLDAIISALPAEAAALTNGAGPDDRIGAGVR